MLQAQLRTAARYLGKIFLAGLCEQHKSTPGCIFGMIILGKPQQHVATWRVLLGLTACIMSSQFLPVVYRFCTFWCIHQCV